MVWFNTFKPWWCSLEGNPEESTFLPPKSWTAWSFRLDFSSKQFWECVFHPFSQGPVQVNGVRPSGQSSALAMLAEMSKEVAWMGVQNNPKGIGIVKALGRYSGQLDLSYLFGGLLWFGSLWWSYPWILITKDRDVIDWTNYFSGLRVIENKDKQSNHPNIQFLVCS